MSERSLVYKYIKDAIQLQDRRWGDLCAKLIRSSRILREIYFRLTKGTLQQQIFGLFSGGVSLELRANLGISTIR
jgi:hypothetical protein